MTRFGARVLMLANSHNLAGYIDFGSEAVN